MTVNVTPALIHNTLVEIDVVYENQNKKRSWCYLFNYMQQKPLNRLPN